LKSEIGGGHKKERACRRPVVFLIQYENLSRRRPA
jgi:hypothetical protein